MACSRHTQRIDTPIPNPASAHAALGRRGRKRKVSACLVCVHRVQCAWGNASGATIGANGQCTACGEVHAARGEVHTTRGEVHAARGQRTASRWKVHSAEFPNRSDSPNMHRLRSHPRARGEEVIIGRWVPTGWGGAVINVPALSGAQPLRLPLHRLLPLLLRLPPSCVKTSAKLETIHG